MREEAFSVIGFVVDMFAGGVIVGILFWLVAIVVYLIDRAQVAPATRFVAVKPPTRGRIYS